MSRCVFALLAWVLAGCSAIPAGRSAPDFLPGAPMERLRQRVAVAPPSLQLTENEALKGYRVSRVWDADEAHTELVAWLEASGSLRHLHPVEGEGPEAWFDAAWEARDDAVLEVAITEVETTYDGHNGWWIPNILNWAFWIVPAWFVATEEYTLTFTAEVGLRSVDGGTLLFEDGLEVSVTGTFDEFDRGFQLFGFIAPNNEAENWEQILARLLPAAQTQLGEQLVELLRGPLYERLRPEDAFSELSKTLALCVGVSNYRDTVELPPLPFAAADARRVSAGLTSAPGGPSLPARQVQTLVGADATKASIRAALSDYAARARPRDQTLLYFAGYGTRGAAGDPRLILDDPAGSAELPLSELRAWLDAIPGQILVILDTSFDGRGRSIQRGPTPTDPHADADVLAESPRISVLFAAEPEDTLHTSEDLAGGLFTHHLVAGLEGQADDDADALLVPSEWWRYVTRRTVSETAYFGRPQRPVLRGRAAFRLTLTPPSSQRTAPLGE